MSLSPDFVAALRRHFSGEIRLDMASRILYSTDASIYQIEPLGVAIPRTQDDLHAAVEQAAKYGIPILARGAGSSLAGQAIGEALILDCSRWLDSILEINPDTQVAVVEPGVILSRLNQVAAKHGLMFGPDPASAERATLGGVISNNATGAHSILYGMTADHLISADVILADGSLESWEAGSSTVLAPIITEIREKYAGAIRRSFPASWRNSAGYRLNYLLPWSPSRPPQWTGAVYPPVLENLNPANLLAGSEGTLAVIRRAKLALVEKPKATILGVLSYNDIGRASDDIPRLLNHHPSAIELIPQMLIRLARGVPAYAHQMGWIVGDPAAVLVVEFSGDRPEVLRSAVRSIGDVLTIAESGEDQARIWNVRKVGLGIMDSRRQAARPVAFIEDCAIPVERLGEFIREVERILAAHGTVGGIYGHASAGCLHIRPVLDLKQADGVRSLRKIAEETLALTLRLGGSMSSEHGDGIVRGEWLERTYGSEVVGAMRTLKHAADPDNLLNPHKLFDAPPMDSHLRYGQEYRTRTWIPSLSFGDDEGLAGAIEQCNGAGVCRKDVGVMCPSFQATREESNSTRGRANLLRAFIGKGGLIPGGGKIGPELFDAAYRALDLCLACKGCTSECPSGVDMPRLKYEFMHEYFKTHPRPLRDYLFGYFQVVAKWLSPFAIIVNPLMQNGLTTRLLGRLIGVTRKRPWPVFVRAKAIPNTGLGEGKEQVLFLSDVFSRYLEPQVEQSAFDLLAAGGYEVQVLSQIGAGASLLSKGFIEAAQRHAGRVLDEIRRLDPGSKKIVIGIEPPELYCLKHEYVSLLPDRQQEIESLTSRIWLFEEFMLRSERMNTLRIAIKSHIKINSNTLTFHPHCHQRAEGPGEDGLPAGTAATAAMLQAFGYKVITMEAGCCGMAGTFGYDTEHFEFSRQVGELGVLPQARKAGLVLSTGSACRMQIRQVGGVQAKHPIEVIADLVMDRSLG
jgi:FAD/FMN-containing dehydrogenase/Fe-S oxidoreductase